MRTVKGTVLTMLGIVTAIVAVGCGDTINGCESTAQMLGWVIVSCGFLTTAILLCALAVSEEMGERSEQECRKIKRVAHHTNEWRDAQ